MKPRRAATAVLVARPKPEKKSTGSGAKSKGSLHKPGNFRILMVKRSAKSNWMKDIYVFPGGSVDENDFPTDSLSMLTRSGRQAPNWEGDSNTPLLYPFKSKNKPFQQTPAATRDLAIQPHSPAEVAFAFRTAALREIFEESGILATPSASSNVHTISDGNYPALAPIDLDYHFTQLASSPTLQQKFIPFQQLAHALKIPMHEVFRRIVHLNDQDTLDSINAAITDVYTGPEEGKPAKHATFLDLCASLGFAETTCSVNAQHPYTVFDTLTPIAKWISPCEEKKRFDTIFYLSIVDPEQIKMSASTIAAHSNSTEAYHDPLDAAMSHFYNLSVKKQQDGVQQLSDLDPTCKHGKKLLSSTLSNEISDISWISPLDILSKLDQVTFAPPTQYILSQLSGFTLPELEQLLQSPQNIDKLGFGFGYGIHTYFDEQRQLHQESENTASHTPTSHTNAINTTKTAPDVLHQPTLIPFLPRRLDSLSTDPYSYATAKSFAQNNTQQVLSEQQRANTHFSQHSQTIGGVAINTKGHVLLPGDFEHPLTQPLLLRTLQLLEEGQHLHHQPPTTITAADSPAYNQYAEFAHHARLDQHHIDALTSVDQLESIFNTQFAPPIKLSNVSLFSTPLQFIQQHPEIGQTSGLLAESALLSKVLKSPHKDRMSKLIHYHRVVDSLTHNNWEIVTSNPKFIHKTREELAMLHQTPPPGGVDAKL